jgi:Flp pilus assembly protein TadD
VADEALVHLARGQALEQQGEGGPPVLREYQVAARLDPSEANRLALGAAYERAGLVRQALVEYRSLARSLAHPSGEVAARLERLRGEFRPSDPEQGSP